VIDALVESLVELNEMADGRAYDNPLRLEYDLRAWHGGDSRIPLLIAAASLAIPRQLMFGWKPGLLKKRVMATRGYSEVAASFAVGAWAAACRLVEIKAVPALAEAPRQSLAEVYWKLPAVAASERRAGRHCEQEEWKAVA
jgi:hypothetical protein